MGPARNTGEPAPRAKASPYGTRAGRTRSGASSEFISNSRNGSFNDVYDDDGDAASFKDNATNATGREHNTDVQLEALNKLFWSSWGFPTHEQKEALAYRVGKSYHSTDVWMQNRRHPRDPSKKPWFLKLGLTKQIIEQLDQIEKDLLYLLFKMACPSLDEDTPVAFSKINKKKRRATKLIIKRNVPQGSHIDVMDTSAGAATFATGAQHPPLRRTDRISSTARHSIIPGSSHSSGGSNGSASPSPRQSPSRDVVPDAPSAAIEQDQSLTVEEAAAILFRIARDLMQRAEGSPVHIDTVEVSHSIAPSSCDPVRAKHHTRASQVVNPYARPSNSASTSAKSRAANLATSENRTAPEQAHTGDFWRWTLEKNGEFGAMDEMAQMVQPRIIVIPATPRLSSEGHTPLMPADGMKQGEAGTTSYPNRNFALLPYVSPTKARYSQSSLRTSSPLGADMPIDEGRDGKIRTSQVDRISPFSSLAVHTMGAKPRNCPPMRQFGITHEITHAPLR